MPLTWRRSSLVLSLIRCKSQAHEMKWFDICSNCFEISNYLQSEQTHRSVTKSWLFWWSFASHREKPASNSTLVIYRSIGKESFVQVSSLSAEWQDPRSSRRTSEQIEYHQVQLREIWIYTRTIFRKSREWKPVGFVSWMSIECNLRIEFGRNIESQLWWHVHSGQSRVSATWSNYSREGRFLQKTILCIWNNDEVWLSRRNRSVTTCRIMNAKCHSTLQKIRGVIEETKDIW